MNRIWSKINREEKKEKENGSYEEKWRERELKLKRIWSKINREEKKLKQREIERNIIRE